MLIEKIIPPFGEWIGPAILHWLLMMAVLAVCAGIFGYALTAVNNGPIRAFAIMGQGTLRYFEGLVLLSPRRVLAVAFLAVQEAVRKKVLFGFLVFIIVLMMGSWFLDTTSPDPARLYLSAVMTWSSYMILLLMLMLSTFSLPADMKSKTIFTVTTKPIYSSELVLGRMLGFTIIGTAMLGIMCLLSYLFVNLGLSHTHILTPEDVSEATLNNEQVLTGDTRRSHGHAHPVVIYPDHVAFVDEVNKHQHELTVDITPDGHTRYILSPNRGSLVARVPVYGKLQFRDNAGMDQAEGINVGDEWMYRSFIAGGTPAAAIWTFDAFTEQRFPRSQFPDGIPIEMNIGVFRSHKGNIEQRVLGSLSLRNPETGLMVDASVFQSEEFAIKSVTIPYDYPRDGAQVVQRKRSTPQGVISSPAVVDPSLAEAPAAGDASADDDPDYNPSRIYLFRDLVASNGQIEIWLKCVDNGQYFGAAQADLYLHVANANVPINFVKGFFGIWQQMVLVIAFGVMFSTFLSGSVAMIATGGAVFIAGFFRDFLIELAEARALGGGPLEAFWRLMTQMNLMTELPASLSADFVQMGDTVLRFPMRAVAYLIPPLADFNYVEPVSSGFDVPPNFICVHGAMTIGYLLPVFLAAYLFFRNREVAK